MAKNSIRAMEHHRHLMIVEGYSDLQFLVAALNHLQIGLENWPFIFDAKGKNRILSRELFDIELRRDRVKHFHSISIFVDADQNPSGTIQSIQDIIGLVMKREVTEGQWLGESPKLGLFVFPDGQSPGELETLVWNAIPDDNLTDFQFKDMKTQVGQHLDMMKVFGWPSKSHDKAKVGTYLASAWDEDPRVGPATSHRKANQPVTIDFSWPGFTRLLEFLRQIVPTSSV